jgi:hypothetical protein
MKKPKINSLKKTADRLFSELIRRRAVDNYYGTVQCVTCGAWGDWRSMDCGHYESRRHNNTRYDKRNCAPQCHRCNRFEEGRKFQFGKYLVEKYGEGIIEELRQLAYTNKRFTIEELQEMIKQFKKELGELKC